MEEDVSACKLSQYNVCLLSSHGNSTIVNIPAQKGINKLNWASTEGGDEITFEIGDSLHSACRTDYINLKKISQYVAKENLNQYANDEGMSRRSSYTTFEFSTCCVYCAKCVATKSIRNGRSVVTLNSTYDTKNPTRQKTVNFVNTKAFGETLKEILNNRKDK